MKLSEWLPILLSLLAFATAVATAFLNHKYLLHQNRQKADQEAELQALAAKQEEDLKTVSSKVDLLFKEQSTAVASLRAQLNHEVEDLSRATAAAQRVKDALEAIAVAARHPNTVLRADVVGEFSIARLELQKAHVELVKWLQDERLRLHKAKNTFYGLASRFVKEIEGDKLIAGASDQLLIDIDQAVAELRLAQQDLREAAMSRQSMLNEGLID